MAILQMVILNFIGALSVMRVALHVRTTGLWETNIGATAVLRPILSFILLNKNACKSVIMVFIR